MAVRVYYINNFRVFKKRRILACQQSKKSLSVCLSVCLSMAAWLTACQAPNLNSNTVSQVKDALASAAPNLTSGTSSSSNSTSASSAASTTPTSTTGTATIPNPANKKIAYVPSQATGDLFVMNEDGSEQTKIATLKGLGATAWAPNGKHLVAGSLSGNPGLFVINTDGSGFKKIKEDGGFFPTWSPDSSKIAYGNNGISIINADGSGDQKIIKNTNPLAVFQWSPDGNLIAINDDYNISIVKLDGSQVATLTKAKGTAYSLAGPLWSKDMKTLMFKVNAQAYTSQPDGSDKKPLTVNGQPVKAIWSMSSDGKKYFCSAGPDSVGAATSYYILADDFSVITQFKSASAVIPFIFTSDGNKIIHGCSSANGNQLCNSNLDGSNVKVLLEKNAIFSFLNKPFSLIQ